MHLYRLNISITLIVVSLFFVSCQKDVSTTPDLDIIYTGKILCESEPSGARIFLNGCNTGKVTPDSIIHLEPGIYNTEFRLSPYLPITKSIIVDNSLKTNLLINFYEDTRNYGAIECHSNPTNALIIIDDVSTGKYTPATISNLWPNMYKVTCSYPEHRDNTKYIFFNGGETVTTTLALQDTSVCVDYNATNSDYPATHASSVKIEDDGTIWVGNSPGGIVKIKNSVWTYFNTGNSVLESNNIVCIEFDNDGNKWFGTSNGLARIDNNDNLIFYKELNSIDLDNISAIVTDKLGNVFVSSSNSSTRRNLWKYDGISWTRFDGPADFVIISLAVGQDNKLWVGENYGLACFENGEYITPPGNYYEASFMIKQYTIDCLKVDEQGFVWLGTSTPNGGPGGLFVFDGENYNQVIIPTRYFSHINIDRNGDKWISSYGKYPFASTDDSSPVLVKVDNNYNAEAYSTSQLKVPSVLFLGTDTAPDGTVWIASRDKGLIKFKTANL